MDKKSGQFGLSAGLSLYTYGKCSKRQTGAEKCTNTSLSLDSPGSLSVHTSSMNKRKWADMIGADKFENPFQGLDLGRSPSSSECSKRSSATMCTMSSAKETDEEISTDLCLNFDLHLGNSPSPKKPVVASSKLVNLQLTLSTGPSESVLTSVSPIEAQYSDVLHMAESSSRQTVDEGSTSGRRNGLRLLPFLHSSEVSNSFPTSSKIPVAVDLVPAKTDLSSATIQKLKKPVACTSGLTEPQQHYPNTKNCQFPGCGKGARGASRLCIGHGGGRRCQKEGCKRGAEGRTIYCKAHGGGRRCEFLGCTKSAEGHTDFCIAHGGGRRCSHEGCRRAARGKSGRCIRHGGGKRCQRENCTKSAEGYSGMCISHGGGRRCQYPECNKGAQGSTNLCKAHGGGKRCTFPGCTRGAEGSTPFCKGHGGGKRCTFEGGGVCPKSVHGGTQFCVAHGGGKRCAMPDCTKSARGRTDFCVGHGGGKRCKFEGCGKSAQGCTDFCKKHGGGKRCLWGQPGSSFGFSDPPCDRFARGKSGLCAAHGALVQDHRVHGGGVVGSITSTNGANSSLSISHVNNIAGHSGQGGLELTNFSMQPMFPNKLVTMPSLPEGRVHGGSLLAKLAASGGGFGPRTEGQDEQYGAPYAMPCKWV